MPKIDINAAPTRFGTGYPAPFDEPCKMRRRWKLGDAAGIDQFGVNLLRLPPGQWTSQRHWHTAEDEFTWVVEGEVVLVEDEGETILRAGDCAGFKAGVANGHHLVNKSPRDALYLEIGARSSHERAHYPDVDLVGEKDERGFRFSHKAGEPYPEEN